MIKSAIIKGKQQHLAIGTIFGIGLTETFGKDAIAYKEVIIDVEGRFIERLLFTAFSDAFKALALVEEGDKVAIAFIELPANVCSS